MAGGTLAAGAYCLAWLGSIIWGGIVAVHVNSTLYSCWRSIGSFLAHRRLRFMDKECKEWPGVTVIKPLKGVDAHTRSNVGSFFRMNYPEYELVFSIGQEDDPAVPLVRSLMAANPHVNARLSIGTDVVGVNPKINNILEAYESSPWDIVWICDSSIVTTPETIRLMVMRLGANTGMVHQLPAIAAGTTWGQYLEQVYFATQHARIYLFGDFFGLNCVNGMSIMFKRSAFEEKGGLRQFSCYLAEDFFMSKALHDAGMRHSVASPPARQVASRTVREAFERQIRWFRLRRSMDPLMGLVEPFSECFLCGVIGGLSLPALLPTPVSFGALFGLHVALWLSLDLVMMLNIHGYDLPSLPKIVASWAIRETCAFPMWVYGMQNNKVQWKDTIFNLQWGGIAEKRTISPEAR